MTTAQQLEIRFREIMLNGEWVSGTNYKKMLSEISFTVATRKIDSLNTISDLTAHIHYYIDGVLRVMKGGELDISDKKSFDHLPIKTSDDWERLYHRLINDCEEFATLTGQLTDEFLQTAFAGKNYGSWERNINAMIEHCYYHQGQIALIRKLLLNSD